jgi:hypothetical protein
MRFATQQKSALAIGSLAWGVYFVTRSWFGTDFISQYSVGWIWALALGTLCFFAAMTRGIFRWAFFALLKQPTLYRQRWSTQDLLLKSSPDRAFWRMWMWVDSEGNDLDAGP